MYTKFKCLFASSTHINNTKCKFLNILLYVHTICVKIQTGLTFYSFYRWQICVKDTKRAKSKDPTKSEDFPERILWDLCIVASPPPYTHTQHLQAIFCNPSPSPSPHTHTRTHAKEHKNKDATKSEVFPGRIYAHFEDTKKFTKKCPRNKMQSKTQKYVEKRNGFNM